MRLLSCVAAAGLLLILSGCSDLDRVVVSGRVTYNGQPVPKGTIRFIINDRPTAMGTIENGQYKVDHHGGVPLGTGKVEIEGFENTDKLVHGGATGVKVYEVKPILPPKYNTKTELTVEITPGNNEKNFDLTP